MTLREIDALIAEKVMGVVPKLSWQALNEDETASCISFDSEAEGREWLALKQVQFPNYYGPYHVGAWKIYASYTENPAASKALREKLAEMGHTWTLMSPFVSEAGTVVPDFACVLDNETERAIMHVGGTEELAVALCALRSVGIDVEVTQ